MYFISYFCSDDKAIKNLVIFSNPLKWVSEHPGCALIWWKRISEDDIVGIPVSMFDTEEL